MKFSPLLFISLILFSQTVTAKIYKWTDENGQTHFSDIKPQTATQVDEPLSKLSGVESDVTTAEINKFIIGTWQIPDRIEENNGMKAETSGTATFHQGGKISFDMEFRLNGRKQEGIEMSGRWYISDINRMNFVVTTSIYGNQDTKNSTEIITKINQDILVSIDEDGKTSTVKRAKAND